jgi:pantoate--beta-alanine ligase
MSSRNALLDPESRRRAPALSRALFDVSDAVARGERDAGRVLRQGASILSAAGIEPEYFSAVSTETLAPVSRIDGETLVALAARIGPVRLIDNVIVAPPTAGRA